MTICYPSINILEIGERIVTKVLHMNEAREDIINKGKEEEKCQ